MGGDTLWKSGRVLGQGKARLWKQISSHRQRKGTGTWVNRKLVGAEGEVSQSTAEEQKRRKGSEGQAKGHQVRD